VPNQFGKIVERNAAARNLNASTDYDETDYHYSLPSNRWNCGRIFESDRFLHPVMREFL